MGRQTKPGGQRVCEPPFGGPVGVCLVLQNPIQVWGEHSWLIKLKAALRNQGGNQTSVPLRSSTSSFELLLCEKGSPSSQLKVSVGARGKAVSRSCSEQFSPFSPLGMLSGWGFLLNIYLWWSHFHFYLGIEHRFNFFSFNPVDTVCCIYLPRRPRFFYLFIYLSSKESYFHCPLQGRIKAMICIIEGKKQNANQTLCLACVLA